MPIRMMAATIDEFLALSDEERERLVLRNPSVDLALLFDEDEARAWKRLHEHASEEDLIHELGKGRCLATPPIREES